ncbi:MAG: response regulator transcription factor [Flavobacteriia bacterium]|nr:response regulator transcription factor [Flavobacteriia bacterium]OIP45704.1 MAG: two-component system response regulator [Flavobacteriaceae bacterium CG2_30_31_66]PIV97139.1 MAG: DNA-binding response regulator [Flavobacteriaceae bacterium CG17_big_fil_post_rev_8_21_14_2_50_31_13]PIX11233.1 MAG: DNA-binding response regulator [Flavobacteriaceae bacterium CG_4_8_14_3_um_filter_31_8]PIY14858.1 MAG: DNA-binding response regulator [Flavobacteriaceae bacterium CG_4_10_14_3_um_filter_31_253]PIZ09
MTKIKILLAEDEASLGMIVKESLESRDFIVFLTTNGEEAFKIYQKEKPDILVLDVMMPKKDGFTLAKEIRLENKRIPIIFLTAKSQTSDVLEGFQLGGNDYLKKPFSMEELIIRVKSLLNRIEFQANLDAIEIGNYQFNFTKQTLSFNEKTFQLTSREAELLFQLSEKKNELLDRTFILNKLWGNDDFFNARSMDVFISKLRKKLQYDPNIQIINVRGFGYKLIY